MDNESKQQLIKILTEENEKLKSQVAELEARMAYLKQRIADLISDSSLKRRGLPWG
tara:strand:- start:65 stop:232 length:168 start_codon:yes stop_codon:yes gene_type:complete